jgi:hypothetical protein
MLRLRRGLVGRDIPSNEVDATAAQRLQDFLPPSLDNGGSTELNAYNSH